ncbi:hypothetical protein EROM_081650 [Encephalitozoon romaleae SJ-2008]|uniref:Uncharacterized protein n=1 Tax=Encephalitozoon romaleae (strain SJ-2008) TaxID=1178016 RepID=I6ZV06_ENCRO|nr:hypothetical protein EROM_081650 [Encephalitozoon romaleae SJ-2008]AFN83581.1 hypothetical protein EROM_081650 [Encephalitozoon romaleae SJ-2008]
MDIEKRISSVAATARRWLEDFRYIASIALNFLECFFYALAGIICLTYSEDPLKNIYCKYVSCILIALGIIDGLQKVPTTYLVKNSKAKEGTYKEKTIRYLKGLRKFFIKNKLSAVIDFFGALLMIFAISVMIISMCKVGGRVINSINATPNENGGRGLVTSVVFSSSGLYSLLSLLYSLYNLVMQGYQYISGFRARGVYSNTAGIVIRFENDEEEHHGVDKEPFSSMPMITLTEVIFMLIFIIWGTLKGGFGYVKQAFALSFIVQKIVTATLQYMAPFFRHSGSKNVILLPIIFISLLSLCAYVNGLGANIKGFQNLQNGQLVGRG